MFKQRLNWAWAAISMTCFGLVGCGGASDSPNSTDEQPTAANFAELAAKAVCSSVSTCCSAQNFPHDENACLAFAQRNLQDQPARVRANKARWDGEAAQRCLDELSQVTGQCNTASPVTTADCGRIAVGIVAEGAPCSDSRDCAAPAGQFASCVVELGVAGGTCQPARPLVPVGGSCRVGAVCVLDAVCDFLAGKCVTPAADGAACTSDDSCRSGHCESGVCAEVPLATQASCAVQ